jgi:hypothetical protein
MNLMKKHLVGGSEEDKKGAGKEDEDNSLISS